MKVNNNLKTGKGDGEKGGGKGEERETRPPRWAEPHDIPHLAAPEMFID